MLAGISFVLVAAIGSASAGAAPDGKDVPVAATPDAVAALDGRHLYVVPAGRDGDAAIKAASGDVVARYESFSLVSADGSANRLLTDAGADLRDDMAAVTVADGKLDPSSEPELAASSGPSLAIVQFVGPIKDSWLDGLRETGGTVVTYISENAYVVYASGAQSGAVAALADEDEVRAVTPFTATDKTAPGIDSSRHRRGCRRDDRWGPGRRRAHGARRRRGTARRSRLRRHRDRVRRDRRRPRPPPWPPIPAW